MFESITVEILKTGFLGAIILVLGWVLWQQKQELSRAWIDRLADVKALAEIIREASESARDVAAADQARTRAAEALARIQELAAAALSANNQEIVRLRDEVKALREDMLKRVAGR